MAYEKEVLAQCGRSSLCHYSAHKGMDSNGFALSSGKAEYSAYV